MKYRAYSHRYADIILNANYAVRKELERTISDISLAEIERRYEAENLSLAKRGKKGWKGKQAALNAIFRDRLGEVGWEKEKNVFGAHDNDLVIDFWKMNVGVDVAFNHRSFIGGDLLRLQAAGEVKNVIDIGVYICGTREFTKYISPKDASSMVSFERVQWYLEHFHAVLTVPVWLIGLER